LRHRVDRVEDEVRERFPKLGRVALDQGQVGHVHHRLDHAPFPARLFRPAGPGEFQRLRDDLGEVPRLEGLGVSP
jgi:hypothetical protein